MKTYHVSWEIEVDATSPRAAAEQVQGIQRDPASTANVFMVKEFDSEEEAVRIDLDVEDDHEIVLKIQKLLDKKEWTADTMSEAAEILRANGYPIRDVDDQEDE